MNERPILITGGRVVDPSRGTDRVLDVLLKDGAVARVDEKIAAPKGAEVIVADGLIVAPGFVDLHVHFREPGFEHKETIATGTAAAAAGGFTTVCCMANTKPVIDDASSVSFLVRRIRETAKVRVLPIGAVSKNLEGEELSEIGLMKAEGIVALSDDGRPVSNSLLMRRAMEYASMFGLTVVVHAEDHYLAAGGSMNEGSVSTRLGLQGIPNAAETAMIARDIQLAALTRTPVHFAHVSTKESLAAIRQGRAQGVKITCEVTPHHLTLTDEDVAKSGYDTRFKMNPPLRSEEDRQALVDALADGTIDAIATDHAPHHADEKGLEFADAPFGVTGLETALPVLLDALLPSRILSLTRLVDLLSTSPSRAFGLSSGTLSEGSSADVVIFSTTETTTVRADGFFSKSANSPWIGRALRGRVERTFFEGREVFRRSESRPEPQAGAVLVPSK